MRQGGLVPPCTVPALSWHSNELPSSVYSSLCHSMQIRRSQAHEHDHLNIFEIFYFTRIDTQLSLNDEKTLRGVFKKPFLFKTAFWMHLTPAALSMCKAEFICGLMNEAHGVRAALILCQYQHKLQACFQSLDKKTLTPPCLSSPAMLTAVSFTLGE